MNDKIAFVGDSFCAEFPELEFWTSRTSDMITDYPAWTTMLLEEYNATAIQKGVRGDCLFHSCQRLLKVIDDADYVIICVTEPYRLANSSKQPMTINIAEDPESRYFINKEMTASSLMYYKNIMNYEFHRVAQRGIIMQMDQLLSEKKKKCIWFACFYNSMSSDRLEKPGNILEEDYQITSGPYSIKPLYEFAELHNPMIPHSNHFSKEQNKNMFKLIKDIIDTDAFLPRQLNMSVI